jgi:L-ribulose-5-phosphate 3-epimerase
MLGSAALAALGTKLARAANPALRVGVTDWNLRLGAKPESIPLAAKLGFDGIQISFGRGSGDDKLPLDSPELIDRCLTLSRENKIPIAGTCVDRLHVNGLKSDPLARKWVLDSIRLTKALNTQVLLLPFFGKWALQNKAEMDTTADTLKDLAPVAAKAGVILGLEDTISAEDNVRIMERAGSKNVLVYYDVGNSTRNGFDVVKEIRWLGKDRICQIHLKDNPNYMGEGTIPFPAVIQAIRDIGWSGYLVLETDTRQGSTVEADMAKNLAYTRKLLA